MTATLFCLLMLGSGITACGDDESSSQPSGTSSPTAPVCQDLEALSASVDKLKKARIGEDALPVLSTELANIKSELSQLRADASAEYETEIGAVRSAATSLESSIEAASDSTSAAALAAVAADVRTVGSAVRSLGEALVNTC